MICLDTSPVIWGVRGTAEPGQEDMILRAKNYIAYLDDLSRKARRKIAMLPSPVVTEYLAGSGSPESREKELRVLEKHFKICAFDLPASVIAAEIDDREETRILRQATSIDKQAFKVDTMILAVAISNGAEKLVTHNPVHFRTLAKGRIQIIEIPNIAMQGDLGLEVE